MAEEEFWRITTRKFISEIIKTVVCNSIAIILYTNRKQSNINYIELFFAYFMYSIYTYTFYVYLCIGHLFVM